MTTTIEADIASKRFWAKVKLADVDECWEWQGSKSDRGYGTFNAGQNTYMGAHRFAYLAMVGDIPEGLDIDHLCRNRACVNPWHLEPVSRRENIRRGKNQVGVAMRSDECRRGHPLDAVNTRIRKDSRGRDYRDCRKCVALRRAAQRAA